MTRVDEEVDEIIEYTFDQLSNKAKEKVRDTWRAADLDYEWWADTYEDAVRIGALMGFEVGEKSNRTARGVHISSPDIWFSGFCSQGDGCCWSGWIKVADLSGAALRMKIETSDEELLALAARCEELYGMLAGIAAVNRLLPEGEEPDWPDVSLDMRINVEGNERMYNTYTQPGSEIPVEMEDFADGLVGDFASWIYTQLEREYEYLTSDEVIDAQIECACLMFDADGNEQ